MTTEAASNYKIRISCINNSTIFDESDADFSIESSPQIQLVSPNGGEAWQIGATEKIEWISNVGGTVKIELYKSGSYYSTIASIASNTGTYLWTIPASLTNGSDYQIKISHIDYTLIDDLSNGYFSIQQEGGSSLGQAVDNTSIDLSTSGNAIWFQQFEVSYYGGDAAQSGDISDSQASSMETTITGPKTLRFYWKVSSESSYDFLRFYIDGARQEQISGSVAWIQKEYTIDSGSHTLKWSYEKDGSASHGSDAGWVDKIELEANTPGFISTSSPTGGVLYLLLGE